MCEITTLKPSSSLMEAELQHAYDKPDCVEYAPA
jgi:hypothetical protein